MRFFRIFQSFFEQDTYIIAELNDAELGKIVSDNRLKKFYFRKTIIFEISSKNADLKFGNSVSKNNQQFVHFDGKNFEYLIDEKNVSRTKIKMRVFAISN